MKDETLAALHLLDEQTAKIPGDRATHVAIVNAIKHIEHELQEGAKAQALMAEQTIKDTTKKPNTLAQPVKT